MAEETAVIESQMEETRKSLAEKVEALEKQVVSTVKDTTDTVTETVSSVTEAVQSTVGSVTETVQKTVESVKDAFDFRKQVGQHPWLAVGGAAAIGYLLGALLTPRRAGEPSRQREADEGHSAEEAQQAHWHEPALQEHAAEEAACMGHPCGEQHQEEGGFLSGMSDVLGKLKGMAIGATTGVIGEMIRSAVPDSLRGEMSNVVDRFTTALGGTPIHSQNH